MTLNDIEPPKYGFLMIFFIFLLHCEQEQL